MNKQPNETTQLSKFRLVVVVDDDNSIVYLRVCMFVCALKFTTTRRPSHVTVSIDLNTKYD